MTESELFDEEPDDTHEAIMQATYRALCAHGYADLTIQRIGDEFAKSKSLLYHHYEDKDALLVEFLDFMLENYTETLPRIDHDDAWAELQAVLEYVFSPAADREDDFIVAMVELRAQAAHDETFRAAFTRSDQFIHDQITAIIQSGIDEGVFADVDPNQIAALILMTFTGATTHRSTTEDTDVLTDVHTELQQYLDTRLRRQADQ